MKDIGAQLIQNYTVKSSPENKYRDEILNLMTVCVPVEIKVSVQKNSNCKIDVLA